MSTVHIFYYFVCTNVLAGKKDTQFTKYNCQRHLCTEFRKLEEVHANFSLYSNVPLTQLPSKNVLLLWCVKQNKKRLAEYTPKMEICLLNLPHGNH